MLFDTRGKPGFHRFPFMIGDDVQLRSGGPRMKVVDFDETGEITVSWHANGGRISEMKAPHSMFMLWEDATEN